MSNVRIDTAILQSVQENRTVLLEDVTDEELSYAEGLSGGWIGAFSVDVWGTTDEGHEWRLDLLRDRRTPAS